MEEKRRSQWHPPFCAAMELELRAYRNALEFDREVVLNTKPIQLDLLVIKKAVDIHINNEVGAIFRGHNIFEFKSPEDGLSIDDYFKALAYACLYKAASPRENDIPYEDITISLMRERKPMKLMGWFVKEESNIEETAPGVYYISEGATIFPTQVIVSSELNETHHLWLRSLTRQMSDRIGANLVKAAEVMTGKRDRENFDSVLRLAMGENKALFKRLKEASVMNEALLELMRPEMEAATAKATEEGRKEGRKAASDTLQQLLAAGRMDDLKRAIKDSDYMDQLIEEFCGKKR